MNKRELIKSIEDLPYTEGLIADVITINRNWILESIEQLDEPKPLKLKDIISRMKQLFPLSRSEWIDGILHEFGEGFGSIKYREGYEQGKLEGKYIPEKVKVPQFVADYIERTKNEDYHLLGAMAEIRSHKNKEIDDWFYTDDNIEVFARAWFDGYTIEEKRYRVKMKAIKSNSQYLVFGQLSETWWFGSAEQIGNVKSEHTQKELEEAGFGWVFDCLGIEIEEVE